MVSPLFAVGPRSENIGSRVREDVVLTQSAHVTFPQNVRRPCAVFRGRREVRSLAGGGGANL